MPAGRPKIEVDEVLLEQLCEYGHTTPELAALLNCSEDTLERNYGHVMAEGKSRCKAKLRKKQVDMALAGNVTMLIWLGKNMMGQTDKTETFERDTPFDHNVDREAIIERIVGNRSAPPPIQ